MAPHPKFKKVVISYPPVPTRKWKSPFKPHVPTPFKRKPQLRKPIYPSMHPVPHSSLLKIWHQYLVFEKNSCILYGRYACFDPKFPISTRGKQATAMCMVAVGYTKIKKMQDWTINDICQIMEDGHKLYLISVAINKNSCDCTHPKEVHPSYFINDMKFVLRVEDEILEGTVLKQEGEVYFRDQLRKVLSRTDFCLMEVDGKYIAIWKFESHFYIFDPNDRDYFGRRTLPGTGIATVLKFVEFHRIVKHIQQVLCPAEEKKKFTLHLIYIKKYYKEDLIPPDDIDKAGIIAAPKKAKKEPPKSCLASRFPELDINVKVGPIPEPPDAVKKKKKKEKPVPPIDYDESTTPSYSALFDEERLQEEIPCCIPSEKPAAPPVTYFKTVIPQRMGILIGSCHQKSNKCTHFEGKQALGNAIAAAGMLRIYRSKYWYPKIIDEILLTGETIYIESRQKFMGDQELTLQNVVPKFKINKREYKHRIDENTVIGQVTSEKNSVLDLKSALKEFFADHDVGIIRGPVILCVWLEEGIYYMFDPNERDNKGRVIDKELSLEWPDTEVQEKGFACVTWFTRIDELVNLYIDNLCKSAKKEHFYISKIQIRDYYQLPDMWFNFIALKPGKWILRGTFCQNNSRFSGANRNTQCTCIATLSVAISKLVKCKEWDRPMIDDILVEGDKYYQMSVDDLKKRNLFVSKQLMLGEVFRKYTYRNKQLNIIVEECIVNGALNMKPTIDGVPDLKQGFQQFFKDCDSGVLTCRGLSFAFWKYEDHYFYFDSHGRDEKGYVNDGGLACCLRFESLHEMVEIMLANLNPDNNEFYNIGRVDATIWERTAEGTVKPDFHDYKELSDKKGIIRAGGHQGDVDLFDVNADKQTIPNMLSAFAMSTIMPSCRWNKNIMDQILTIGDKLYSESRLKLVEEDLQNSATWETEEKPKDVDLVTIDNVIKEVKVGANIVKFEFKSPVQGIFEPERVKRDRQGNVIYQDYELQNVLWNALETVEENKNSRHEIIIDSEHISLALWKEDDLYYVFDPKGKDKEGNFYGRDLWSAKIVIMDEDYEGLEDYRYPGMAAIDFPLKVPNLNPAAIIAKTELKTEELFEDEEDEDEDFEDWIPPQQIDISDAKACAIMFATFDDVYQHIIENVRPNRRVDGFKIFHLSIYSMPELKMLTNPQDKTAGNWYEFEEIEKDKWILRGTMDLRGDTFPPHNRGKQHGSMCVSACVYCRLYALPKFKSTTVDYILKYGDKLHTAVRKHREIELKQNKAQLGFTDEEIMNIVGALEIRATETLKQFLIGEHHVYLEITPNVVQGDVTVKEQELPPPPPEPKEPEPTAKGAASKRGGRPEKPAKEDKKDKKGGKAPSVKDAVSDEGTVAILEPAVKSLKVGITEFFENNFFGILTAKGISIAIFKILEHYYSFDPESRGPSGLEVINGTACIMRFTELDKLVDVINKNMTKDGSNSYQIDAFTIKCTRAYRPAASIPAVLPLNPKMTAFREIRPDKHILRGSFHQDNPKFKLTPNATGACNALVAIAMSMLHPSETWSKPIVDDVLLNAYRLYKQSVIALGYDFNEWEDKMVLESIHKEFKIGVNHVEWNIIKEGKQKGLLVIKDPEIPNLRRGCEEFFMDYTRGVIQCNPLTVGIWIYKDLIYMFDPNPRGPNGIHSTGGTACLIIFSTVKDLVDHFLSNVPPRLHKEEFTISPVEIHTNEFKPKKIIPIMKEDILKVKEIDSLFGCLEDEKEKKKDSDTESPKKKYKPPKFTFRCHKEEEKKKSKTYGRNKEKSTKEICCCPDKSRLIPHKMLVIDESKFKPEDKKLMMREKSEAKKLKELMSKERRIRAEFYPLDDGDAIVRAHYSQNSSRFSPLSRNKQTHANALVAIVMSKLHDPKTWSYKNIEIILESGDVLYKDSYMKYRPKNLLLGLKNLLRTFYIYHLKITTVIYKPFIFGYLQYEDVYVGLLNFFMQETAGIIMTQHENLGIAIFQKAGQYFMFDPRDSNVLGDVTSEPGCAFLMKFHSLENLVEKYLKNTGVEQESESLPRFSVCAVSLENVERINK